MAYEILTESYGRRLPKITAEADSTDDLATLGTNYAEGSTCVIGDKTYSLDKVQGWVEPGSSGGGGGGDMFIIRLNGSDFNVSFADIQQAATEGKVLVLYGFPYTGCSCVNSYTELLFDEVDPSITFTTLFTGTASAWGKYIILKPLTDGSIGQETGDVKF